MSDEYKRDDLDIYTGVITDLNIAGIRFTPEQCSIITTRLLELIRRGAKPTKEMMAFPEFRGLAGVGKSLVLKEWAAKHNVPVHEVGLQHDCNCDIKDLTTCGCKCGGK